MTNKDNIKILITGGDGYVGSNIVDFFQKSGALVYPTVVKSAGDRRKIKMDIREKSQVEKIVKKIVPDVVIHTAALSNLGACEKDPKLAEEINYLGTKNLVDVVRRYSKTKFIFFSSDYVFDGEKGNYKETDKPSPLTVYGKTKLTSEEYIKSRAKNYIILRTVNVFGRGGNFFNFVTQSLTKGEEIDVFSNVNFTPTSIDFLISAIDTLIAKDFKGVIHIAGQEKVSRYQFAEKIAKALGADTKLVKKGKQLRGGVISKDSSLNTCLLEKTIGTRGPSIEMALNLLLGNIEKSYFEFSDDRGLIRGITQGVNWREINYIETVKGNVRGGHYHKKTKEGFYIISGRIEVTFKNIKSRRVKTFIAEKGDIFTIKPNVVHTFKVLSNASWINYLSQPMIDGGDIHKIE